MIGMYFTDVIDGPVGPSACFGCIDRSKFTGGTKFPFANSRIPAESRESGRDRFISHRGAVEGCRSGMDDPGMLRSIRRQR